MSEKKTKAKKAAVKWEDRFGVSASEILGVHLEVVGQYVTSGHPSRWYARAYSDFGFATRESFKSEREAKAAALELAKLVAKWGKR